VVLGSLHIHLIPNPSGVLKHLVFLECWRPCAPDASSPLRLVLLDWTYSAYCAASEAHKEDTSARSEEEEEEVGRHLMFRSSFAAHNCASVCICGDNPAKKKKKVFR